MVFGFRKQPQEKDDPDITAAYEKAKKERRLENAKIAGIQDADRLLNHKPFHEKIVGMGKAFLHDLGSVQTNPDALINFHDTPKRQHKRRKRR